LVSANTGFNSCLGELKLFMGNDTAELSTVADRVTYNPQIVEYSF